MKKKFLNQLGFNMVEGLVAGALIAGLGAGVMKMSETSRNTQRGMMGMNELGRDMEVLRASLDDPKVCDLNFADKEVNKGVTLNALLGPTGSEMMKMNTKMANNTYQLTGIEIGNHNPNTKRTEIHFSFKKMEKEGRSQSMRRTFYVFTEVTGGKISKCIDPLQNIAEGTLFRTCLDADPTKQAICEENAIKIAEEVKQYYCSSHPYLQYDAANKKCFPLDAGKKCPAGQYIRGWKANGQLDCYSPPVPTGPVACTSWTAWTPAVNTQCKDVSFQQSRSCNDGVTIGTTFQDATGTKTTAECEKPLECSVSYYGYNDNRWGTTASNGSWNVWGIGDDNDRECNNRGCAIDMGLSCTGPARVRLKYQFRMYVNSSEITSPWSNTSGALTWGGPAVINTDKKDECDGGPGCGLRVVAETDNPDYKCSITYQYRNEKVQTIARSDGVWSVVVNDADDDNCEKNWGCGIKASISCSKL